MTMKSLSYLDTYGTGGGTPGPSSSQLIIWLYIRMTVFAFESNLQRVPSDVAICTGVTSTFLMHFLFSRFILYFTRLLLMASFNQVKRGAYKLSLVLELGSCDKVSNREAVIIKFSWFWLELTGWGERLTLDTAFNTAKFDSISTMCFSKLTG